MARQNYDKAGAVQTGVAMYNQNSISKTQSNVGIGMLVVSLAAVFYCYEYLLRVAPSVMNAELMAHYQINDFQLGSLTAYYYYIYAPMQLPVGLLVDRYGPKRLMVFACLCCAVGAYLFVCSHSLLIAKLGRFLVGLGSSFAFVGVLKLATIYLPKNHFAVVSGMTMALGQLGAMLGDVLLTVMIKYDGWQKASIHAAIFGLVLTFALIAIFRIRTKDDDESDTIPKDQPSTRNVIAGFIELAKNKELWKTSVMGCLLWVPIVVFAEYLGIDYLKTVFNLTSGQAAMANSMIFIGMASGGPLVTTLSNKLESRLLPIKVGCVISALCMSAVIMIPNMPIPLLFLALYLTGLTTSTQVIVFPMAEEIASKGSAGTALALTNMLVMISGIIFQPLTGYLLNTTQIGEATHVAGDFQYALGYIPLAIISTLFVALMTNETFRRTEDPDLV